MSCRIDRIVSEGSRVVFRVSGRIHAEDMDTLRELLGREKGGIVIELEEITLVDREAVTFLALSEINGIELRNCPAYIREWVDRERAQRSAELSDLVVEHASRRIIHFNVTDHPTADWTTQQFREALPSSHEYQFLIHDRDSLYSAELDEQIRSMGLVVIRIPVRAPKANALCERLIGTIRRECLDFLIPLSEKHLRRTLRDYVRHYNEGRPHSSLGPGIPDGLTAVPIRSDHSIGPGSIVRSRKVLGGLRNEYWLEKVAA
jgi:hypothetical protein